MDDEDVIDYGISDEEEGSISVSKPVGQVQAKKRRKMKKNKPAPIVVPEVDDDVIEREMQEFAMRQQEEERLQEEKRLGAKPHFEEIPISPPPQPPQQQHQQQYQHYQQKPPPKHHNHHNNVRRRGASNPTWQFNSFAKHPPIFTKRYQNRPPASVQPDYVFTPPPPPPPPLMQENHFHHEMERERSYEPAKICAFCDKSMDDRCKFPCYKFFLGGGCGDNCHFRHTIRLNDSVTVNMSLCGPKPYVYEAPGTVIKDGETGYVVRFTHEVIQHFSTRSPMINICRLNHGAMYIPLVLIKMATENVQQH